MKSRIALSLVLFALGILCHQAAFCQWQPAGSLAFSAGPVSYTSLAVDKDGTPYIAFQDLSDTFYRVTVMKYNDSAWINVGPPRFSFAEADYISLAIDSATGLHVAYEDFGDSLGGLTVRKFNGTNWDTLGISDFTPGDAQYISLAVFNGTPYVAFEDYADSFKTSVVKYNGSAWAWVGGEGFSAAEADYIALVIDHSGKPYVAYQDNSTPSGQATVMTFNGADWIVLDSAGISTGSAEYISLAIDHHNNPLIAYSDGGDSSNLFAASVMTFNDGSWSYIGPEGFTPGEVGYTSIAIDKNGTPFMAYSDISNAGQATVMQFNGANWSLTGNADFSAAEADYTSLAIDNNDIVYVGYVDNANSFEASVMKYQAVTGINEINPVESINVFPNPSAGNYSVKIKTTQPDELELSVHDLTGQLVWQNIPVAINGIYNGNINLAAAAQGIYLLQVKTGAGIKTLKLELLK